MASHAIFEELNIDYEMVEIDLSKKMQKSAEYLAINPNGKVPTLIHDGQIIYESAAILMYILDQHPEGNLAPQFSSPLRGVFYQYMSWMSNTLQEAANRWAHPENYTNDISSHQSIVDKATIDLSSCWNIIDKELAENGPWILGDTLSGADFHLFMIAYWSRRYTSSAQNWPNVNKHYQSMLKRESIQKMMLQEGL